MTNERKSEIDSDINDWRIDNPSEVSRLNTNDIISEDRKESTPESIQKIIDQGAALSLKTRQYFNDSKK